MPWKAGNAVASLNCPSTKKVTDTNIAKAASIGPWKCSAGSESPGLLDSVAAKLTAKKHESGSDRVPTDAIWIRQCKEEARATLKKWKIPRQEMPRTSQCHYSSFY